MDWPTTPTTPLFVSTWSRQTAGFDIPSISASFANLTWVANLAVYIPFTLPWPYDLRRFFWWNGGTVTGTADIGIYNADGGRIVSTGATAQSGANALQYVSPTAQRLPSGRYYLGLVEQSATASLHAGVAATAIFMRVAGVLQEATAGTLPATMTPAAITNALYPFIGFTKTASGF